MAGEGGKKRAKLESALALGTCCSGMELEASLGSKSGSGSCVSSPPQEVLIVACPSARTESGNSKNG